MMIGQHKRNLNVVPFRSSWKELFEQEKDLLDRTLGEKALQIEHIGSTSIPGMVAKPIIDIMVAVVSLTQATDLIPKLEALGYEYKPLDTVPERLNKPLGGLSSKVTRIDATIRREFTYELVHDWPQSRCRFGY